MTSGRSVQSFYYCAYNIWVDDRCIVLSGSFMFMEPQYLYLAHDT